MKRSVERGGNLPRSFNGRTTGSDPVNLGSNPGLGIEFTDGLMIALFQRLNPRSFNGRTTGSDPVNLGSNPGLGMLWRVRLAVRTLASHVGNTGPNPVPAAEIGSP